MNLYYFCEATLENDLLLSALLSVWDDYLPATFGYSSLNASARAEITRSVNLFYFGNEATPTIQLDRQQLMNVSNMKTNERKKTSKNS